MIIPTIPDNATKAEAALLYARAGIPVFPCNADKEPHELLARQRLFHGFKHQTTDEDTIRRWWLEAPDANPGSALDEHTLVLDIDDPDKWTEGGIVLPHSGPVQTTANSSPDYPRRQQFFDINGHDPEDLITTLPALGAETKGLVRGYVLLPPSTAVRKDGITMGDYRWRRTGATEPVPEPVEAAVRARGPKPTPAGPATPFMTVGGGPCAKYCDNADPIPRDPGGYQYLNDFAFHRVTYHRETRQEALEDALLWPLGRMDPPYPGNVGMETVQKVVTQIVKDLANDKVSPDPATPQQVNEEDILSEMRAARVAVATAKANPARATQWLVRNLIRPGTLDVLASAEGLGKSFIRLEIALRGALGPDSGPLFGYPPFTVQRQFRTALMDEENGEDEEADREEAALRQIGATRGDLGDRYTRYSFAGADLASADGRARIEAVMSMDRPDLLVLDTGTGMVGEEWGPSLKDAIRWLRRLADRTGVAVLIIVHLVKPVRDPKTGARSAAPRTLADVMGQWTRPVDAVFVMSGASGDNRAHFAVHKRVPHDRLVLAQSSGVWTVVAAPSAPKVVLPKGAGKTGEAILKAIADGLDVIDDKALGVSHGGFHAAMKALREGGLVGPGLPYALTPAGLSAVHPESTSSPDEEEDPTLDL